MAKIGLDNFRFGILTEAEDGTPSYAGAIKPGKAISCNVDVSSNDAKLYADNTLAESDTSFQQGTVTINVDDDDIETQAIMLGHDVDSETGAMKRNSNDIAPYIALGRIITKLVGGNYKYKVEFLYKVKMSEPSQSENTKGESVEFQTPEMSGVVSTLKNGDWSTTNTFDTHAEALEYLEGLLGTNPSH